MLGSYIFQKITWLVSWVLSLFFYNKFFYYLSKKKFAWLAILISFVLLLLLQSSVIFPWQAMIDSWSGHFLDAYSNSKDVQLYQVPLYILLVQLLSYGPRSHWSYKTCNARYCPQIMGPFVVLLLVYSSSYRIVPNFLFLFFVDSDSGHCKCMMNYTNIALLIFIAFVVKLHINVLRQFPWCNRDLFSL